MIQKKLIGLAGFAGSGKSTAAAALDGKGWKAMAFADALKDAAKAIFSFSTGQLHDPLLKLEVDRFWGFTPRWAMQRLGTEAVRRGIGDDIWIRALFRRAEEFSKVYPEVGVVVTDVRFENEAEAIKKQGGRMILIDRPGVLGDGHVSELLPLRRDLFDVVISNSGSVEDLHAMVINAAQGE